MPIVHKTIKIDLPNQAPYDTEFFLETFAGEHILPIYKNLKLFWFSRYVNNDGEKHILFRFSTARYNQLEPYFNNLRVQFGGIGCGDYDFVSDLGNQRFIGTNARCQEKVKRANLVYSFLTASAKLLLASIVRTPEGRWHHETEQQSRQNQQTSLESIHHLFCNMTNVPTWVVAFQTTPLSILSSIYASYYIHDNPQTPHQVFRIRY